MLYNCVVKPKYKHLRNHNGLYWFNEHGLHHMKLIDMYAIICYSVFNCRITEIKDIIMLYNGFMKPKYENHRNHNVLEWFGEHGLQHMQLIDIYSIICYSVFNCKSLKSQKSQCSIMAL